MYTYQLQGITTLAEIDLLIENALRKRRQKTHSAEGIDMSSESSEDRASRLRSEQAVAQEELAASVAAIAVLPEGPVKEEELTKKVGLEFKIRKLNESAVTSSMVYVTEKVRDKALLLAEVAALDDYISQLNVRKAEL